MQTEFIYDYASRFVPLAYRFTGKERDAESGLDNFISRYYGSTMGRFMSPDGVFDGSSPDNPQSWNLYSYVQNNPLINADPDGHDCIHINNDTGAYEGTDRGDCDNSTEDKANTGHYVDGTVDTINENRSGQVTGFSGTSYDTGNLLTGAFASPLAYGPLEGPENLAAANMIGNGGMAAIKYFAIGSVVGGTIGGAGLATGVIGGETGASLAGVGRSGASLANRLLHIFGNPAHGLGALVQRFGGPLAAYEAMQLAAQSQVTASGPFTRVAITVGGIAIQINGTVIDGVVKISTAYVPH